MVWPWQCGTCAASSTRPGRRLRTRGRERGARAHLARVRVLPDRSNDASTRRLRELVALLFTHPDWGLHSLDLGDISECDCWESAVLSVCALNAAMAGAEEAVRYLLGLDETLPFLAFNQKGGHTYGHAVEFACKRAWLAAPVAGVKALLSGASGTPLRPQPYGVPLRTFGRPTCTATTAARAATHCTSPPPAGTRRSSVRYLPLA